jgi:hypothetical protein
LKLGIQQQQACVVQRSSSSGGRYLDVICGHLDRLLCRKDREMGAPGSMMGFRPEFGNTIERVEESNAATSAGCPYVYYRLLKHAATPQQALLRPIFLKQQLRRSKLAGMTASVWRTSDSPIVVARVLFTLKNWSFCYPDVCLARWSCPFATVTGRGRVYRALSGKGNKRASAPYCRVDCSTFTDLPAVLAILLRLFPNTRFFFSCRRSVSAQ